MSAPVPDLATSLSNSGYEDGLGRRTLVFDRASGLSIERLALRPELGAFERVLGERAARLTAFEDDRIARVRGVQRDAFSGGLTVDSDAVSGSRLSDLIDDAAGTSEEGAAAGLDVAVGFLLEILPAIGALHTAGGMTHGTICPGRIFLTSEGRIVLADALYGEVLQRLRFAPARLWAEFGVAVPAVAGSPRLDVAADIAQAGMAALMIALGRRLRLDDFPHGLPGAVSEVIEVAQIRCSAAFATRLDQFLRQILPLGERRQFSTAQAAFKELRDFADGELDVTTCRAALDTFSRTAWDVADARRLREAAALAAPPPIPAAAPAAVVAAPAAASPAAVVPAASRAPEVQQPPAPVAAAVPEPAAWIEPAALPEAVATGAAAEAISTAVPTAPIAEEAPQGQPVVAEAAPRDAASLPVAEEAATIAAPIEQTTAAASEPEPAMASGRRKRNRGPRAKRDKLRSNAAPPAPLAAPVPAPVAAPAPIAARPPVHIEPIPVRPPDVPIRMPFAAPPAEATPAASPYTSDKFWEAPAMAPAPPAPPRTPAVAVIPTIAPAPPAAPAPLRVKAQPPTGYSPPPVARSAGRAPHADEPAMPIPRGGAQRRSSFPWKAAAAALIVVAGGAFAGRGYLLDRNGATLTASPKPAPVAAAAAPAAAPAAGARGAIEITSTPAGARVLVDGTAAGETPLTVPNVKTGRRVVTLVSSAGTVRRTVKVQAGQTVSLDVPIYSGFVNVIAPIILEVAVGGKSIGTTEQGRLLLPPGRHELTLSNRDLDYIATHMVEIESGEEFRTKVEPKTTVSINAQPWAEVWIDGQRAGETPLSKVSMLLGTHEVLFKHPQHGERRVTATVKAGSPATISVDFNQR